MKKLIIASVLAAASFTAQAQNIVRVCDVNLTGYYDSESEAYIEKAAIVHDNGTQFSAIISVTGDELSSPVLSTDAGNAMVKTKNGVTFARLKNASGYAVGMESEDKRLNFINCTKGRSV